MLQKHINSAQTIKKNVLLVLFYKKSMKRITVALIVMMMSGIFNSCTDSDDELGEPKLIFIFKFDPNQPRLNNLGQIAAMPAGHAGQSPLFNAISAHYIEMAESGTTPLGNGAVLYHAPETEAGGATAIDFNQSVKVGENEVFFAIPLRYVNPGIYRWMRVSLSYQNYQVSVRHSGQDYNGTVASFVGYNTYINSFNINGQQFDINGNRLQGYWAFALNDLPYSTSGQSPVTTVPNPLWNTSPIPAGSCVVTGNFFTPLEIKANEKKDIIVTLSLSTNKSFEWIDTVPDNKYEPAAGENVVDMGIRGLIPTYERLE